MYRLGEALRLPSYIVNKYTYIHFIHVIQLKAKVHFVSFCMALIKWSSMNVNCFIIIHIHIFINVANLRYRFYSSHMLVNVSLTCARDALRWLMISTNLICAHKLIHSYIIQVLHTMMSGRLWKNWQLELHLSSILYKICSKTLLYQLYPTWQC